MANGHQNYIQKQKNLAYFRNLYALAFADNHLAPEELQFLHQIAHKLNISPKEFSSILGQSSGISLQIPSSKSERLSQLEDLILMMMIDQEVHEKEYALCLEFAEKLGFNKLILEGIITRLTEGHS
ncbi:MAG: hypothetical protein HC913_22080 [Microscillaceae bacterium]|nr:hypothetical protein [Microscillaceae bacterium]